MALRELSLFTGAGGGLLGSLILGWRTVAAVEIDPYCQRVLCARGGHMADAERDGRDADSAGPDARRALRAAGAAEGIEPEPERVADAAIDAGSDAFPVYSDIRTFHPTIPCDIVTGGFPCQPHSQAGKRLGGKDDRDLWPDTVRVLRESGAPLGFFENVPGLLTSLDADGLPYFGRLLGDLSEAGFDAEWCVLGADDVGAPHRRKRLWILAYSPRLLQGRAIERPERQRTGTGREYQGQRHDAGRGLHPEALDGVGDDLADAASTGPAHVPEVQEGCEQSGRDAAGCGGGGMGLSPWWIDPADVGHADAAGPQGHGFDGERAGERAAGAAGTEQDVAHAGQCGGRRQCGEQQGRGSVPCDCGEADEREPVARLGGLSDGLACGLGRCVPRVAVGVPERVNRLRALGNGQVPLTMAAAFTLLARQAGLVT